MINITVRNLFGPLLPWDSTRQNIEEFDPNLPMGDLPKSTIFTEEIDQEPWENWEKTRGCPLIFRQGCGLWVSSGANGSTVNLDVFSVSICIYIETSDI